MNKETKTARLPQARVTVQEREMIEKAAELIDRDMSYIVRKGAVEKAQSILSSSKSK